MSRPLHRVLLDLPADLVRVFRQERLTQVAASLAFSTLLTLVPLVSLVLVVASSLPGFNVLVGQLDSLLMQTLLPGKSGGAVAEQVYFMASKARQLTWPWVLVLAGMVFLLLHTLEVALNQVWGIKEGRPWLRRLPLYLSGMVGVPLLMGGLTSLLGFLIKLALGWNDGPAPLETELLKGLNLALLGGFFALFYYAMPHVRVSPWAALWGGVLVSLGLAGMKLGLLWYLARVSFYSKVYGTLSALPIFLIWLYLAWILVLVVAVLVASLDGALTRRRPRS